MHLISHCMYWYHYVYFNIGPIRSYYYCVFYTEQVYFAVYKVLILLLNRDQKHDRTGTGTKERDQSWSGTGTRTYTSLGPDRVQDRDHYETRDNDF